MTPVGTPDPEYPTYKSEEGIREDGNNLIDTWLKARPVGNVVGRVLCPLPQGVVPGTH